VIDQNGIRYRLLSVGESIRPGDESLAFADLEGGWKPESIGFTYDQAFAETHAVRRRILDVTGKKYECQHHTVSNLALLTPLIDEGWRILFARHLKTGRDIEVLLHRGDPATVVAQAVRPDPMSH